MCRRKVLHGCCMMAFGFGLLTGHCMESWFLCSCGGLGIVFLGFYVIRRK